MELECAGDGLVSCEEYEAAMDMVKVKQKHGMRRNVEACFHMETLFFFVFSQLNSSLLWWSVFEYIRSDLKPHKNIHGLPGH